MNPEAQRIAIAEACGWSIGSDGYCALPPKDQSELAKRLGWFNPLSDLNAMHEAEKALVGINFKKPNGYTAGMWYSRCLHKVSATFPNSELVGAANGFMWIHATAAQRAEAFLKTIGKWEETPSCVETPATSPTISPPPSRE